MISKKITDVKDFMNRLLLQDTFDSLLLYEAAIKTATVLSISGKLNTDFFDTDELEALPDKNYACWSMIKPLVFQAVKGKKQPSSFKLVFMLPASNRDALVMKYNLPLSGEDIAGLFFHIYFERNMLRITSGTSLRVFTPDKRIEQVWDDSLLAFMAEHHICVENIL